MNPNKTGLFKHLTRFYVKDDLVAAFSLALITIPLSLGIAMASGAPPMAGIIAVVIGGLVATFFRSSCLTVNGPSAGLIVIIAGGIVTLGDGDVMEGFRAVLAASMFAGGLLMLAGLLRMGRFGDIFPPAVINGMLAAIGLIILSQQVHIALGVKPLADSPYDGLMAIPESFGKQNPFVSIIAFVSIAILIIHSRINNTLIKTIPAPVWVLLAAIPFVFWFNYFEPHNATFLGNSYFVGPNQLIDVPDHLLDSFIFPSFHKIGSFSFWWVVIGIAVVAYIETLISARIMDRLDPLQRQTNLDKDLFAVGISTIVSGSLGGLPIITAIPIASGAQTKWANLYNALFIIAIVLGFAFVMRATPQAALAGLLVFTGYKLASFKMLRDTYRRGDEQFIILLMTMITVLTKGALWGLAVGILVTLILHHTKANLSVWEFIKNLIRPIITTKRMDNVGEFYIRTKGVINFINVLQLKKVLRKASKEKHIILDMSHTRLIDYTVLEYLHEYAERYDMPNSKFELVGLDAHETASRHPNAMRVLPESKRPQLSKRQRELEVLTKKYEGQFWPEIRWDVSQFKDFYFFRTRAIEYKLNTAKGNYAMFFEWETCDITFAEGALFASQEQHTSVALLHLPFNAPVFLLEREDLSDKIGLRMNLQEDINFAQFPDFSSKFLLQGTDIKAIEGFFTADIIRYLEQHDAYHIECNGTVILLFKQMRFASPGDLAAMHEFNEGLAKLLLGAFRKQALDVMDF